MTFKNLSQFPTIPDKRYFKIKEVSDLCDTKPAVLRQWEMKFKHLTPTRRQNIRCYQRKDIDLIRKIYLLINVEKLTDKGVMQNIEKTQAVTNIHNNKKSSSQLKLVEALTSISKTLET